MTLGYTPYLTINDYLPTIQENQLVGQILDELTKGINQRKFAENWAISKIIGIIGTEYNLEMEIKPTLPYVSSKVYNATDRVILSYNDWVASTSYSLGTCIIYQEFAYQCITANNDASFDLAKWRKLGAKNTIQSVPTPHPIFSLDIQKAQGVYKAGFYKRGDKVWWENHIWTCVNGTKALDHSSLVQNQTYGDIGYLNTFPGDPENPQAWTDDGAYTIAANTLGTENQKWIDEDNRDPLLVQCIVDFSLFILHKRISPRNIPELRIQAYEDAKNWLENLKSGKEKARVGQSQPSQGKSFRWGSQVRKQNGYV